MRDLDVRRALLSKVLDRHRGDPATLVLEEFGVDGGDARVDVAVLNGTIHGYEIKSPADTLRRLPRQVEVYGQVLDYVTLVVGGSHPAHALELVPEWWGVKLAIPGPRGAVHFQEARRARRNPAPNPEAIAYLLWRPEALDLLEDLGAAGGIRSATRGRLAQKLAQVLPLPELRDRVRERVKARRAG